MSTVVKHTINNNDFILHSSRTIFWEQEKILLLSDLHLGKTGHFRKSGIAVPHAVMKEDMQRLIAAVQFFNVTQIIIVGDLFHSVSNKEHDIFLKWRNDAPHIKITLVKGNHDIIDTEWYNQAAIDIAMPFFVKNGFVFVHQMEDYKATADEYIFTGHIHPAVIIKGLGKQSLRFPCFFFTKTHAVLPAFGKFTGTYLVEPTKKEKAYAIVNNSVVGV
jgi:uncharacterized protein